MAYCSDKASRKLRIISFLGTVSVVIIHTNYLEGYVECSYAWWVGNVVAYLQRWAVPLFFVISGFFMEREFRDKPILQYFKTFLSKKSRAIVVPYLLWGACYGLVAMTLLKIGVAVQRGESDILGSTIFANWGHWTFFDSLFGVTHAPLIGALWYLRLLILIIVIMPAWIVLFRYVRWLGLLLALIFILGSSISGMYQETFALPCGIMFAFKVNSLGWVLFGMSLGAFEIDRLSVKKYCLCLSFFLWVVAALLPLGWEFQGEAVPLMVELIHRFHPVFTLVALWGVGDWLSRKLPERLPVILGMGFWIYCMHHPITGYVGALGHIVLGRGTTSRFLMQAFGWIITLTVCIFAGLVFKRLFPKTYKILCGGR